MPNDSKIYQRLPQKSALRQSEILSNLVEIRLSLTSIGTSQGPALDNRTHPFAMVLSQDCDLEQDYRARNPEDEKGVAQDKRLPSILFCEVIEAAALASRSDINSRDWKIIRQNKNERYQFLQKVLPMHDNLRVGLPELAIDFKRYFTVPSNEVYLQISSVSLHKQIGLADDKPRMNKAHRRCYMASPYLEHVSTRFCYFQSRIALPADHVSEP